MMTDAENPLCYSGDPQRDDYIFGVLPLRDQSLMTLGGMAFFIN